jgi:hypothetical protein
MITPSYSLTATERVLPRLALDFTTAALDPRVTFTRTGNTATVTNSSGVIVDINADLPRFDFDPVTLVCRGLLIEESRTNVLLNSLINGADLATQTVVVTAAARTLSFYGTGQVVLSGAHSATVTGSGAYPTRTTLTFTPSVGSLILTVTGTVQFAQLEAGAFATSYIPTTLLTVTRNADVATMTGTNFSDWFNATEGTFVVDFNYYGLNNCGIIGVDNGTDSNRMSLQSASSTATTYRFVSSSGNFISTSGGAYTAGSQLQAAYNYKAGSQSAAINAASFAVNTQAAVATVDRLRIGTARAVSSLNGHIQKINYYPQQLIANEMLAFTK